MKKIKLILLSAALIVLAASLTQKAEAQLSGFQTLKSRYSVALDTVTNTGSKTMTAATPISGPGQNVAISTYNVALTGTMKGVATLWGSTNGVKYSRIRSVSLRGAQVDSLLLDAAHPNYTWIVIESPFKKYQVVTTGIGTTTFTVAGDASKK